MSAKRPGNRISSFYDSQASGYFSLRRLNHKRPRARRIDCWSRGCSPAGPPTHPGATRRRSFGLLQLDFIAVDKDVPDLRVFCQKVATCNHKVSDLSDLDRAELIGSAENLRGIYFKKAKSTNLFGNALYPTPPLLYT